MTQLKNNWDETLQMFDAWFHHRDTGRPLMNLWVSRDDDDHPFGPQEEIPYTDDQDMYTNPEKAYARVLNQYDKIQPLAEAFPQFSMNLGAGSMALYLGSDPIFKPDTVWFHPTIGEYADKLPLQYDPDNPWWKLHQEILKRQAELVRGTDIVVCIPDIIENIDILAALRGPQECCFDLYDYPEEVEQALQNIADIYMKYYDPLYALSKRSDNSSAYTAFNVIGYGKTVKIQCDFSALLSPSQFDNLVLPSLRRQCDELDNILYHLDGPECLIHADSVLSIEKLGALQWTPGAGNAPAGDEQWYPFYKKVREAGKGLWLGLDSYTPEEAIRQTKKITDAIGCNGVFFNYPLMDKAAADKLLRQYHV